MRRWTSRGPIGAQLDSSSAMTREASNLLEVVVDALALGGDRLGGDGIGLGHGVLPVQFLDSTRRLLAGHRLLMPRSGPIVHPGCGGGTYRRAWGPSMPGPDLAHRRREAWIGAMGSLSGVAALIAAIAVGVRLLRRRAVERARPGRSADRHSHPRLRRDGHRRPPAGVSVRRPLLIRGEGPGSAPQLRVAHLECRRCEREASVYFDVSAVLH